jgi:hypothetical protein
MSRILVLLAGAFVSLSTFVLHAEEAAMGQLYGRGVHAYFAGEFTKALDQLSAAAEAGSQDPRVYYFRGLTDLKLGREAEAAEDFQKGAELESNDRHCTFNVARSLERVQGQVRQQLETYRVEARLAAMEEANKLRKARFESIHHEEERVLRGNANEAQAEAIDSPDGQPIANGKTDSFGNPLDTEKSSKSNEADSAEQPEAKPDDAGSSGDANAESPSNDEPGQAEKPEDESSVPKYTTPIKTSILGALIKGSKSKISKSIGENVGKMQGMMPRGGMPGGAAPGGMMPPPGGPNPFGPEMENNAAPPKKPSDNPFKDENPAPKNPTPEKDPFE